MYDNVFFFNRYKNGDIHVSRNFIKTFCKFLINKNNHIKFYYIHNNPKELTEDMPYINVIDFNNEICSAVNLQNHYESFAHGKNLFIDTWYGTKNHYYLNKLQKISFDSLYHVFNDISKNFFDIELKELEPDAIKLLFKKIF